MRRLVILIAVVLVNLPALHDAWTNHQITSQGREVAATVLETRTINGRHLVDYRLPTAQDPAGTTYSASIDASSYDVARSTGRLAVRVIAGRPGANRPDGEISSPILVGAAVAADVILLVVAGLWLYRRRVPVEPGEGS